MFKVLSLVENTRPRPWAPLIDDLVNDVVLQLSRDGDEALRWKPFYSVQQLLLGYGNKSV